MRKILILASNPNRDLALDREIRDLEGVVKRSKNRDEFEVRVGSAVRPEDLQELLLDCEPQIVHFCGHGTGEQGLVLQNSAGREQLVSTSALSSLFKLFTGKVECVLLNACYSEVQANAISQHINYVIGMSQTILDDAAIAFATGFYRGLGYGRTTDEAYHFGCNAIELMPSTTVISRSPTAPQERKLTAEFTVIPGAPIAIPEHLKPVLKTRQTLAVQPNSANIPAVPTSETKRVEIAQDVSNALEQEAWLKQYRNCVRDFLADGVLTPEEKLRLGLLAKQLGLDPAEAVAIFQEEERLRFASVPPGRVAVAMNSPIQPLFVSESVAPARSQLKQLSLLLGGAGALLGLGIAFFGSHWFIKEKPLTVSPQISQAGLVPPPSSTPSSAGNSTSPPSTANPSDQPDFSDKENALAQDRYNKLLDKQKSYGVCDANTAIAELQEFLSQSTVQPPPQEETSRWENKNKIYQDHLRQINIALEGNNFDGATTEAEQITDHCKEDAGKLIADRKVAWNKEQQDYFNKVGEFLAANNLPDARVMAEKLEINEFIQEAGKRIADADKRISSAVKPPISPPPPSIIMEGGGVRGEQSSKVCYRVSVERAKVRANHNVSDHKVDESLGTISIGTPVFAENPPESEEASSADNPEEITWLKVTVPNLSVPEGWIGQRQLQLLGAAECQP